MSKKIKSIFNFYFAKIENYQKVKNLYFWQKKKSEMIKDNVLFFFSFFQNPKIGLNTAKNTKIDPSQTKTSLTKNVQMVQVNID